MKIIMTFKTIYMKEADYQSNIFRRLARTILLSTLLGFRSRTGIGTFRHEKKVSYCQEISTVLSIRSEHVKDYDETLWRSGTSFDHGTIKHYGEAVPVSTMEL